MEEKTLTQDNAQHIAEESDQKKDLAQPPADAFADALLIEEAPEVQAGYFRIFGMSSLLYALVYTVCMFQNSSGITMPVWIAATILYACVTMKRMDCYTAREQAFGRLKAGSLFYIVVMLLLGIATCSTDNRYMICFQYFGFFVMLLLFLLHNCYHDSQWDFAKSAAEMIVASFGAVGCMFVPFTDGYAYYREKRVRKNKTLRAVLLGFVLAVPCLLVLGFCLMCADAVFDAMVMRLFSGLRMPVKVLEVFCMLLFGYFSSYCGMRYLSRRGGIAAVTQRAGFDAVIAITFTGLLLAMYAVFSGIQVLYLFAGNLKLPEGLTYAAYAQRGFYMLLFVCMVNFMLVLFIRKYFAPHKLLDSMLLLICACTFLMIASSAYRMFLYIAVYQLTFLRVLVLAALSVLTLLMAGVVAVILRPRFPLFFYSLVVVSVVYLCLAFVHVDRVVASYNLSHAAKNAATMDWQYLARLSLDAAPAIEDYYAQAPAERKEQVEADWFLDYKQKVYAAQRDMGLRNFNFSRYRAVRIFEKWL
ncbi:MAG: DUF4173 domain-containing protein [Eubacterium sp.]|nr:DUF4173 domain-containing protein [Eubacterium sp.]